MSVNLTENVLVVFCQDIIRFSRDVFSYSVQFRVAIRSQWLADPVRLPERRWDGLMGLPAGECVAACSLLHFIIAEPPQGSS